jgi:hypothetical protein
MRKHLLGLGLMAAMLAVPVMAQETAHLSIDASRAGAKIDRSTHKTPAQRRELFR